MESVTAGTAVLLTCTFTGTNGVAANPGTVVVRIRQPDGTTTSHTPTNTAVGVYTYEFTPGVAGKWTWEVQGSGSGPNAVRDGQVSVKAQAIGP
jgi:hypothetical protein